MNMLRYLVLAAIVAVPGAVVAVEPTPADLAKLGSELKQRRDEIIVGMLKGDLTAWEASTADDCTTVTASGELLNKAAARQILNPSYAAALDFRLF